MASTMTGYRLSDRYERDEGRVFMSGIQALARLPIEQLRVDRSQGRHTAAFVSGYPGSPLGGFDLELARARRSAPDLDIVLRPAVNEELGATAVMGSQLAAERPDCRYEGIVGFWYGKAPGLDRAGDALRHAVFAGTHPRGGAVALVGDDPSAKSSTLPSSSDATLLDLHMPILYPGDVQEALDLGRHAIALSRASGVWVALKIVAQVSDGTGTVDLDTRRVEPVVPTLEVQGAPYVCHPNGNLLTPATREIEREFRQVRSVLARMYASANGLNRVVVDPPDAWLGLVATGVTFHEMREALARLGLADDEAVAAAGIRLFEMRMPVPFDPDNVRRFARGLDEVVVVEEKNPTLEWLIKDALYDLADRPRVLGKTHEDGRTLMRDWGLLDADAMVEGLRERISRRAAARLAPPEPAPRERQLIPVSVSRAPYFCSGCPHNWSTKVPEGAEVGAGIGCHGMVLLMEPERVGRSLGLAAMGNEGAQWLGMAPFVATEHVYQNLGDGTFAHSGQLAIQAAVAAGVDVTYKLLYNGTVAMTGGQDAPGVMSVPDLTRALLAHGVARVLITTEEVADYRGVELPSGVEVWDRTRMIEAEELLAGVPGTTVLIHDQACAAQTRRLRKRGQIETPSERVLINHRICEACGDCGQVSNCLSVHTVQTPLGTKTAIDQGSCNFDMSCLHGDCPAFMTVDVDADAVPDSLVPAPEDLPEPGFELDAALAVRMVGIGGTGVVTAAQMLATAAMLDGLQVRGLDQTGLSQKAGPVVSDLRLSPTEPETTNLIGVGQADVMIAFDLLAATGPTASAVAAAGRTRVVGSTSPTPTGSMIGHPEIDYPDAGELIARIDEVSEQSRFLDASALSQALVGSAASPNTLLLGVAIQSGVLPVTAGSLRRAIELNGVAVEANLAAFGWGRAWVLDPERVERAAGAAVSRPASATMTVPELPRALARRVAALPPALVPMVELRAADLVGHTGTGLAARFLDRVEAVLAREQAVRPGSVRLTDAVARALHHLAAYKDEYEVARLMLLPETSQAVEEIGGPGAAHRFHLHPPLLARLGLARKLRFDSRTRPLFSALARAKGLRGTRLDPFGRTPLRRVERRLADEYLDELDRLLAVLDEDRFEATVTAAELPLGIRGFEELKMRRIQEYRRSMEEAIEALGA